MNVLDLSVSNHEDKVKKEEETKQPEQMNSKLVAHFKVIPANFLSKPPFYAPENVHVFLFLVCLMI